MKRENLVPGALVLLAVGLILNALAMFFAPSRAVPVITASPVHAQGPSDTPPNIYYLGRDTYFLTSNSSGDRVFLWYYDFSPMKRDNTLELVAKAQAHGN